MTPNALLKGQGWNCTVESRKEQHGGRQGIWEMLLRLGVLLCLSLSLDSFHSVKQNLFS